MLGKHHSLKIKDFFFHSTVSRESNTYLFSFPSPNSAANQQGDTPLHFASRWGYSSIVEILLEYGADPGYKNRRGQTPMSLAHSGHIARLLEGSSSRTSTPTGSSGYSSGVKESTAEAGGDDHSAKSGSAASTPSRLE